MAAQQLNDGTITLSTENCIQINSFNWDLCEIKRYKDEKCFDYDAKRIKWADSFEMLKLFVEYCVGLYLALGRYRVESIKVL